MPGLPSSSSVSPWCLSSRAQQTITIAYYVHTRRLPTLLQHICCVYPGGGFAFNRSLLENEDAPSARKTPRLWHTAFYEFSCIHERRSRCEIISVGESQHEAFSPAKPHHHPRSTAYCCLGPTREHTSAAVRVVRRHNSVGRLSPQAASLRGI